MKNRKAFTVVELIIVISVILVLMGLLVPAVNGVRIRAMIAASRIEVAQLDNAISIFKIRYGVQPPSGITLCENASDWASYPSAKYQITQMWPMFDFTVNNDINRNGTIDQPTFLDGAECLVFFLGGTFDNGKTPSGFASMITNPFAVSTNRQQIIYEFMPSRLRDYDGDGFREYTMSGTEDTDPIVYYSSYDGSVYNYNDFYVSKRNFDSNSKAAMQAMFGVSVPDGSVIPYMLPNIDPFKTPTPFKPQGFQIIAPGLDGVLGDGGLYDSNAKMPPPAVVATYTPQQLKIVTKAVITKFLSMYRPVVQPTDPNIVPMDFEGKAENDNITNFQTTTLTPR
jgi:general secretion pathway protein G